jgi:hypothetical protein
MAQDAESGVEPNLFFGGQTVVPGTGVDVFGVVCGVGTFQAIAQVQDIGGIDGRRFNACMVNADGVPGQCAQAPDGGVVSVRSVGGAGVYLAMVFHDGPAGTVEPYNVDLQCRTSALVATPTAAFLLQNN